MNSETNHRGRFIVIEGPNGAGKSTLIRALEAEATRCGLEVQLTREPGGTPFAEDIRPIARSCRGQVGAFAAALLFNAARADNCEKVIRPALDAGRLVLCDRWTLSTTVYQGVLGGMTGAQRATIAAVHDLQIVPDLMVLVLPSSETIERRTGGAIRGGDSFDAEGAATEIRAYLEACSTVPADRVLVINVGRDDTPEVVANRVLQSAAYARLFDGQEGVDVR